MKKNNPLISFIIPMYNLEVYIKDCLKSILDLSLRIEYEIIVVDNNSSDNSSNIVKGINNERIKLINCKDQGVSYARNKGLNHAAGRFIVFIDGDDKINRKILDAIKLIKEKDNVDFYQFPINLQKDGKSKTLQKTKKRFIGEIKTSHPKFKNYISSKMSNNVTNKIISRDFLIKNNIVFKQFSTAEDMEFNCRLLLNAETIYLSDISYYNYIVRAGSAMTTITLKKLTDAIDACAESFKEIENSKADNKIKELLKKYISRTAYFNLTLYKYLNKKDKSAFISYLRQKKEVLKYPKNIINKFIRLFVFLFGYTVTLYAIGIFRK